MGSFKSLETRMRRLAEELDGASNEAAKELGRAVLTDLIYITPVDTSTALSNWQVSVGAAPIAPIPAFFVGSKGSTRASSAQAALADGLAAIQSKLPGQKLYISNLTPYIGDLDRGTSAQFAGNFKARARLIADSVDAKGVTLR